MNWPAFTVEQDHPICQALQVAHQQAATGTRFEGPAPVAGFYAVCDAAFLSRDGISSVVYGSGSLLVAHAPDEYN